MQKTAMQNSATVQPKEIHPAAHPSPVSHLFCSLLPLQLVPVPDEGTTSPVPWFAHRDQTPQQVRVSSEIKSKQNWVAQMVFRGKVGCPRNSAVLASRGWRHGTAGRGPWGCPALHRLQEHRAIMEGHRQPPWHWSVCSCVPPTPTHTAVNLLRQHPAFYSCSCCFDCLPALPQWPEKRFFPLIAA